MDLGIGVKLDFPLTELVAAGFIRKLNSVSF